MRLHKNWEVALPMMLTDLVYWLSTEGQAVYKVSPEITGQLKRRLRNIVTNVGRDQVRDLCAKDGFYLNNEWFERLNGD